MNRTVLLSALAAVSIFHLPGAAEAQVKPRIVIAFDTSGSMALDLNGVPTFGDGVTTGCSGAGTNASPFCGTNCTAGVDTDCDGEPNDSRMYVAKEAVRNAISAFGDVDWALARFPMNQGVDEACLNINDLECSPVGSFVTSYGNPQCNTGTDVGSAANCAADWSNLIPSACRPGNGGRPAMRTWSAGGGGSPTVCTNYDGVCSIGSGPSTRTGDVLVGFSDLGPWSGLDNTLGIYSWLDGRESNFVNSTTVGNYCNSTTTGDCELRPEGPTPLDGLLAEVGDYITPVRSGDSRSMCRPYSVILITDGAETCSGNPVTAAGALLTSSIRTYVVGLDISSAATRTQLNAIAAAGGTDAGGADEAYFADNPVQLAAGLAQIVADSLLIEVCNGVDDDCDGLIDEGVTNACGTCGAVPVETCDGVDNDCDGTTDEGVMNACGGCGAVPAEVCNGLDDNCDGRIDEGGVCGCASPGPEICDGVDNDCDGTIDEGITRPCGTSVGACTIGTQTCAAGAFGMCTGQGPVAETCDSIDNDCDGVIDGISRSCGSSTGACIPGTQICTGGAYGTCTGEVGPAAEICDTIDNDCDGSIDEGNPGGGASCGSSTGACAVGTLTCSVLGTLTCTGGTLPGVETCNSIDDDCNGVVDDGVPTMGACGSSTGECSPGVQTCTGGSFTCIGAVGPVAEVCDGRDNDCDGTDDEGNPGGGLACGSSTGVCTPGMSTCTTGTLTCSGGTLPGVEICNGLDDNCNGLTDEGNPGGGAPCGVTDVGVCELGALACTMGALTCIGETGPGTEICDGLDNDCDGMIDEGNPEGGAACGDDTGECTAGTTLCTMGMLTCDGGTGPTAEICDGLDNDCDGVEDEGLGVGAPCGSDIGECSPGVNICSGGALVCTGEIGPVEEICNLLDDDCDGMVDELALGGACGTDEGICMAGMEQCVGGSVICVGAVDPGVEVCDCSDNDCNGAIDEGDDLCPAGTACRDCGCADPCIDSEFGFTCPTGTTPQTEGDACYCVAPRCEEATCGTETIERDGDTLCMPDSEELSDCVCKNNACTFPCEGVICEAGLACDPRDPTGRCVPDNCTGLGCPAGEVCNLTTTECEADACAGVTCGEACRDGACEDSCATAACASDELCTAGVCAADLCADVTCTTTEFCDAVTGTCLTDMCRGINCPPGTVCDHETGDCDEDPCARLTCPEGEECIEGAGECSLIPITPPDAGVDSGTADAGVDSGEADSSDGHHRVIASGGGGCVCSVPGADTQGSDDRRTGALALTFGLFGLGFWRRRRRGEQGLAKGLAKGPGAQGLGKAVLTAIALGVALFTGGCDVDPYCLDCVDGEVETDTGVVDSGAGDTGTVPTDSGAADSGVVDSGPDGCVPGAVEVCNGFDDDCDGMIDEDIDTDTDTANCGSCGNRCEPLNAFPECVAGACELGSCRTGFYNLDMDDTNGCEYRCSMLDVSVDDSVCDLRDNDCDGEVDEDVAFDTDPLNCGTCGTVCRFAHAAGACSAAACVLGACDTDFYDIDGSQANGCEYSCTPASPATETCNGRDDDCDGMIDEGDPDGGGSCGMTAGECSVGIEVCTAGTLVCTGSTEPTTETCNGLDDDCDGVVDQGDPEGGRLCGSSIGACVQGREACTAGALVCTGAITATPEVCNGLDDDCDGMIDEGNPDGGASCGDGTGACMPGLVACRGGVLVCEGAVSGSPETCNGADDDCDGIVDNGNPGGGASCGVSTGQCVAGIQTCMAGSVTCIGAVGPSTETCNSLDDNCDGTIDDGNPGGGGACGTTTGSCTAGTEMCSAGAIQCVGGTGPGLEICDSMDNNCNGSTDEGFDLMNDLRNCGTCGTVCSLDDAVEICTAGSCDISGCDAGFVDLDGLVSTGCEYACDFTGTEVCNNRDDDCDGMIDEGISPPANFCNSLGECSGTAATCAGAAGWECSYTDTDYEVTEVSCDGLDNDCNGSIDEGFPSLGASCTSTGIGACATSGVFVCDGTTSVICDAVPGSGTTEACNGLDDDCDGTVDNLPLASIATVNIPWTGGTSVDVMQYEASRPDATSSDEGTQGAVACSNAGVLPWTNVTWLEAAMACDAVGTGWQLCESAEWQDACEGPMGACEWGYDSSCSTPSAETCNGVEFDSDTGTPGDQDALFPTASGTFAMCFADWDGAGVIYDLSGNVKEWTSTLVGTNIHTIRGGSYNNIEPGRTCTFDYTAGSNTFSFPNTGFRCCHYNP